MCAVRVQAAVEGATGADVIAGPNSDTGDDRQLAGSASGVKRDQSPATSTCLATTCPSSLLLASEHHTSHSTLHLCLQSSLTLPHIAVAHFIRTMELRAFVAIVAMIFAQTATSLPRREPLRSVFLSQEQWASLSSTDHVNCLWFSSSHDVFLRDPSHARALKKYKLSLEVAHTVLSSIQSHRGTLEISAAELRVVEHWPVSAIPPESSQSGKAVSILFGFNMTSAEQLLCLEVLMASKRIDVVLPYKEWEHAIIQGFHDVDFLEQHFGIPLLSTPIETMTTFRDKGLFVQWMHDNGLSAFLPTIYQSTSDVVFPVVAKVTDGERGEGVGIAHSKDELDRTIATFSGHNYIIEEAIPGKIEVNSIQSIITRIYSLLS